MIETTIAMAVMALLFVAFGVLHAVERPSCGGDGAGCSGDARCSRRAGCSGGSGRSGDGPAASPTLDEGVGWGAWNHPRDATHDAGGLR